MRFVIALLISTNQLLANNNSHESFRRIIETFCRNHSMMGNTLLLLESGRMVISLAERLPAARIADLVSDKVGLETDDRGFIVSAIAGDDSHYYHLFEISDGSIKVHPRRYLNDSSFTDSSDDQQSLGGLIRRKRLELMETSAHKKFTMATVSKELGITRETLHSWETGRGFPNKNRLKKLAELLSLEIDTLQRLRAEGKKYSLAQEMVNYLERQVREEGITFHEIENLKTFKQYLKVGIDNELAEHRLGANQETKFKFYYSGKRMPTRRTVDKLAKLLDVKGDLLWKALIRDKLAVKFDRYNLLEHRHKFTRPSIYEAFKKLTHAQNPPPKKLPTLNIDVEMERLAVTAIDILSYDQSFGAMLQEQLAVEELNDSAIDIFSYRSEISTEEIAKFITGESLPDRSQLKAIGEELSMVADDLYWSIQIEKFLDRCLEHLQAGGKLVSDDKMLIESTEEALQQRQLQQQRAFRYFSESGLLN